VHIAVVKHCSRVHGYTVCTATRSYAILARDLVADPGS